MLQKWRFDDWRVALEPEKPQASVLRCVIYLAIPFPPKFSSLCSTCFQSVSGEITIHIDLLCLQFLRLQDLFLYWMGSEFSHLSFAYNGSSLEGFVTMSSYGTATPLICFLASSLLLEAGNLLPAICIQKQLELQMH